MQSKFLVLLTAALIFGCAKERPYDELYKDAEQISRSIVDTERDHLYLVSTQEAPRKVPTANPFYQGNEKIVKFKWEKSGLNVYAYDKDKRFEKNSINDEPILVIPGDYMEYRCKEDKNGNCVQEEEENKELTWDQKSFFLPKYEKMKVLIEITFLDLTNLDVGCVDSGHWIY